MLGEVLSALLVTTFVTVSAVQDPAADEAAAFYDQGTTKYATSDYLGAVDLFTQAFERAGAIEDDAMRKKVMNTLLFNLAQAHYKAYSVDDDRKHLAQAKDLLQRYIASESELHHELDAEQLMVAIDAELDELDGSTPASEGGHQPARDEPAPAKHGVNGLLVGGIVVTAASGIGVGLAIAGGVGGQRAINDYENAMNDDERTAADARGRKMNGLAIGGGIMAAVFAGTGIALIVVGKKREKSSVALGPGPGDLGLNIAGHF